jgi:predicted transcriptional regulator
MKKQAILISVRPKWVHLILAGTKTLEVRKTKPRCDLPIKCFIYCSKSKLAKDSSISGKVVGSFILKRIDKHNVEEKIIEKSCLTREELDKYMGETKIYYIWWINNLKTTKIKIYKAPQSWCYI